MAVSYTHLDVYKRQPHAPNCDVANIVRILLTLKIPSRKVSENHLYACLLYTSGFNPGGKDGGYSFGASLSTYTKRGNKWVFGEIGRAHV